MPSEMAGSASSSALARSIESRVAEERRHTVPHLRRIRRAVSGELRAVRGDDVLGTAEALIDSGACPRWLVYELVHHHAGAMETLSASWLRRLGEGLSGWDQVDPFACYLLGPAWREGRVADDFVALWARSDDVWKRRSAVASTVALNNTARGGKGDAKRTLAVCNIVVLDREDMVVKAVSWALRALAVKKPADVERYLAKNRSRLAARVVREVENKLRTGLKNPPAKRRRR